MLVSFIECTWGFGLSPCKGSHVLVFDSSTNAYHGVERASHHPLAFRNYMKYGELVKCIYADRESVLWQVLTNDIETKNSE